MLDICLFCCMSYWTHTHTQKEEVKAYLRKATLQGWIKDVQSLSTDKGWHISDVIHRAESNTKLANLQVLVLFCSPS